MEKLKKNNYYKKIIRRIAFSILGLVVVFSICTVGLVIYIQQNKSTIIHSINYKINENISGKLQINDFEFKYLKGFPNTTIVLKKVVLKDSLWQTHKHALLNAKDIEVRLNVWKLIHNEIDIPKIIINDASICIYKNPHGYSNASLFNLKKFWKDSNIETKINEIVLNRVNFISIDLNKNKLFHFDVQNLKIKLKPTPNHLKAIVQFKTLVKKMIFKPKNGSFLKGKYVEGILDIDFIPKQNQVTIKSKKLKINSNPIKLVALVNLGKTRSNFKLDLKTKIQWENMTPLLSPNIATKINRFGFEKPLEGHCIIMGDWNKKGNPKIIIKSKVKNNVLKSPDGIISNCSFDGEYNNDYIKGKAHDDPNSIIILKNFKGSYKSIPFEVPLAKIINLKKPVAIGKFKSDFEIKKLNQFMDENFINIKSGKANINFDFNIDIVDLKISKPKFTGNVWVSKTNFEYVPKKLLFKNSDVQLAFTNESLLIKKLNYKDQISTVYIEGKMDHFLNLFYQDNQKMKVNWKIYSPHLDLKHFLGILTKKTSPELNKKKKENLLSKKLQTLFDKSQVEINLKTDKISYGGVVAENMSAQVLMNDNQLYVKKGTLKTLGGKIDFNAEIIQKQKYFAVNAQTAMRNLNLKQVINSLDNFGLKSIKSQNIKGNLSANTSISGTLFSNGEFSKNSFSATIQKGIINSMGGIINFDGQLTPKNNLFYFNLNTHIHNINTTEIFTVFNDFGAKNLKTQFFKGVLSTNANLSGQLYPNWQLYGNSIRLDMSNGVFDGFGGSIFFDGNLTPKNKSYSFTTTATCNHLNIDQFLNAFNYFDFNSLKAQKFNGDITTIATVNGILLTSGNLLSNSVEIALNKGTIQTLGGTIDFDAKLFPKNKIYAFDTNANIKQVNITQFLSAFDNFGITSFEPKNISGQLNASASIQGFLQPNGKFMKNATTGSILIDINNGALVDFEPIKNVWKIIFPFRDFNNITFSNINGNFKVDGDKVNVSNFKVNSNVLNFDMEGIYSFNKGTNLVLTIPIRNPKKDQKISNELKKIKKRDNGIVLHLVAVDGPNGKIKIKWSKKNKTKK